jgi:cytochrome c oxidase subunit 5b
MLSNNALRAICARPVIFRTPAIAKAPTALRAISTSSARRSEGPPPPSLFGPGAKPGAVPTDYEQATGIERLQLLGEIEGIAVFDKNPLDSSRIGTMADPIMVPSYVRRLCTSPTLKLMLTVPCSSPVYLSFAYSFRG